MRKHLNGVLLVVTCLMLVACGESTHTVSWYKQHPDQAKQKARWCKNDSARMKRAECINAVEAATDLTLYGRHKETDDWNYSADLTVQWESPNKKDKGSSGTE